MSIAFCYKNKSNSCFDKFLHGSNRNVQLFIQFLKEHLFLSLKPFVFVDRNLGTCQK